MISVEANRFNEFYQWHLTLLKPQGKSKRIIEAFKSELSSTVQNYPLSVCLYDC